MDGIVRGPGGWTSGWLGPRIALHQEISSAILSDSWKHVSHVSFPSIDDYRFGIVSTLPFSGWPSSISYFLTLHWLNSNEPFDRYRLVSKKPLAAMWQCIPQKESWVFTLGWNHEIKSSEWVLRLNSVIAKTYCVAGSVHVYLRRCDHNRGNDDVRFSLQHLISKC